METKLSPQYFSDLGLHRIAADLQAIETQLPKFAVAAEHYRAVPRERIDEINKKIRKMTEKKSFLKGVKSYFMLNMDNLSNYSKIPPQHVLESLVKAKNLNCFDEFHVLEVREVKDLLGSSLKGKIERVLDPILFGHIKGRDYYYFIDQWDKDISIDDLLFKDEG